MKNFLIRISTMLCIMFITCSVQAQITPSKTDTSKTDTTAKHDLPIDTNRSDPSETPMLPDTSGIPSSIPAPKPPEMPQPVPQPPTSPTEIPQSEAPNPIPPTPPKQK